VFDTAQEMIECCAYPITANALLQLSVNNNLTANPLTSVAPSAGVIKIVSSLPVGTTCDPKTPGALTPNLRSWATHIQQPTTGTFVTTETKVEDAGPISASEAAWLPQACTFVQFLGTKKGVCQ
jgi:hypothetical protein